MAPYSARVRVLLIVALLCVQAGVARADDVVDTVDALSRVRERGELLWGADAHGGAPEAHGMRGLHLGEQRRVSLVAGGRK